MRFAAYTDARQRRLGHAKAATARPVGTEDLRAFDPDVRLRLPAPKAAPRPFARARATNVEQPSCPRTRNLALSCTRKRRKWPRNRVLARIAALPAPFAAKPRRNPRSRKSTGRARPGLGPIPCQNAVPRPFSRRFPARRTVCAACRTAHAAKPLPVATGSTPLPTRSSGESPPIRTPHAAHRTTYDMRRAPHTARREAPPHSLSISSSSWRLWMSSFV